MRRYFRLLGIGLQAAGVLAILAAFAMTFSLYPKAARLQASSGYTMQVAGTAAVLTDPSTFTRSTNVPILGQIQVTVAPRGRHTVANSTEGMTLTDHKPVFAEEHSWSMATKTGFGEMTLPGDPSGTTAPQGVTVAWPAGARCTTYPVWVPSSDDVVNARCSATQDRGGVSTKLFTAQISDRAIKDEAELALLPKTVTFAQLREVAKGSPTQQATLEGGITTGILKDPVSLTYTYQATIDWWVDPVSGRIIDEHAHEIRTAWAVTSLGLSPLGVVLDTSLAATPGSVTTAAATAKSDDAHLQRVGPTMSSHLVAVGYTLFVLAIPFQVIAWRDRRKAKQQKEAQRAAVAVATALTQAAADQPPGHLVQY